MAQEKRRDSSPQTTDKIMSQGVNYYRPPQTTGKIMSQGVTYYRLFVSDMPRDFEYEDIRRAFSDYGDTSRIFFKRAQNWAFVEYQSIEQAKAAINGLNYVAPHYMNVKFAKNTFDYFSHNRKPATGEDIKQNDQSNELIEPCVDEAETYANIDLNDYIEHRALIPEYTLEQETEIQKWVKEITDADVDATVPFKPGSCRRCDAKSTLMCSVCKIWYCTETCSLADWQRHQAECHPRLAIFTSDGYIIYRVEEIWDSSEVSSSEMDDPNDTNLNCETNQINLPDVSSEKPIAQRIPPISTEIYSKVCIVCVGLPYYWAVLIENCPLLIEVEKALANHCNDPRNRPDPTLVNKCCAPFEGDWYRAKILSKTKSTAKVRFVDYGNESEVKLDEIKTLPPELSAMKPLAFKIQLVKHILDESTLEPSYDIKAIKMVDDDVCLVKLKENPKLVQESNVTKIPSCSDASPKVVITHETHLEETQNKLDLERSIHIKTIKVNDDAQLKQEVQISQESRSAEMLQSIDRFVEGSDNIKVHQTKPVAQTTPPISTETYTKVCIVCVKLPYYWAVLIENCPLLMKVEKALADHCNNPRNRPDPTLVNKCSAPLEGDWYRAKILSKTKSTAQVRFVDYGNEIEVKLDEIKTLPPELSSLKPLAFKIQLVEHTLDESTLESSYDIKAIKMVDDVCLVQLKENPKLVQESKEIETPSCTDAPPKVLETYVLGDKRNELDLDCNNIKVNQTINNTLPEKELKLMQEPTELPQSTDEVVTTHETHLEETQNKLYLERIININTIKVINDAQLKEEQQMTENLEPTETIQSNDKCSDACETQKDLQMTQHKTEMLHSIDRFVEGSDNIKVDQTVCIVCVKLPYYWAVLIENCPLLMKVEKALANHCNNPRNRPDPTLVNKCSAPFEGDWYRAKILSKTKSTAKVRFVDYGNEIEVKLDEIKTLPPELSAMKPLAFKIQLVEHTLDESTLESSYDIKAIKMVEDVCLVQLKENPKLVQESKETKIHLPNNEFCAFCATHLKQGAQNMLNLGSSDHINIKADTQLEEKPITEQESKPTETTSCTDDSPKVLETYVLGDKRNELDLDSNNIKVNQMVNDTLPEKELKLMQKPTELPQSTDEVVITHETHLEETQNKLDLERSIDIKTMKMDNDADLLEVGHNTLDLECSANIIHIQTVNDAQVKEEQKMTQDLRPTESILLNDKFPGACETQDEVQRKQDFKPTEPTEMLQPTTYEPVKFCETQVVEKTQNNLNSESGTDIQVVEVVNDAQLQEEVQILQESKSTEKPQSTDRFLEVCESHPQEDTQKKLNLESSIDIQVVEVVNVAQPKEEVQTSQESKSTDKPQSTDRYLEVCESHPQEDTQKKLNLERSIDIQVVEVVNVAQPKEEVHCSQESKSTEKPQSTDRYLEVCESHPQEDTQKKLNLESSIDIQVVEVVNVAQPKEEVQTSQESKSTDKPQSTDRYLEVCESHPQEDTQKKLNLERSIDIQVVEVVNVAQPKEEVHCSQESKSTEKPQSTDRYLEVCESHPQEDTQKILNLERSIDIQVVEMVNDAQPKEEVQTSQESKSTDKPQSTDRYLEVCESHPQEDTQKILNLERSIDIQVVEVVNVAQPKEEVQTSQESKSTDKPQSTDRYLEVCESHPQEDTQKILNLESSIDIQVVEVVNVAQPKEEVQTSQESKSTDKPQSTDRYLEVCESHPQEDTQKILNLESSIDIQVVEVVNVAQPKEEVQTSQESKSTDKPQSTDKYLEVCESHPQEDTQKILNLESSIDIQVVEVVNDAQLQEEVQSSQESKSTEKPQSTDSYLEVCESHPQEDTQKKLNLERSIDIQVVEMVNVAQPKEEVQTSQESKSTDKPQSTDRYLEVCESHPQEDTQKILNLESSIDIQVVEVVNVAQPKEEVQTSQESKSTDKPQSTDRYLEVCESHPQEDTQKILNLESSIDIQVVEVVNVAQPKEEVQTSQESKSTDKPQSTDKYLEVCESHPQEDTQKILNLESSIDIQVVEVVNDAQLQEEVQSSQESKSTEKPQSTDSYLEVCESHPQEDTQKKLNLERSIDIQVVEMVNVAQPKEEVQSSQESKSTEKPQSTDRFLELCESHPKEDTKKKLNLGSSIDIQVVEMVNEAQLQEDVQSSQESKATEKPQSTDRFLEVCESHPKEDTKKKLNLGSSIDIQVVEMVNEAQLQEDVQSSQESKATEKPQSTDRFLEVCESHPKEDTQKKLNLESSIDIQVVEVVNDAQPKEEVQISQVSKSPVMPQSTDKLVDTYETHLPEVAPNKLDLERDNDIKVMEVINDAQYNEKQDTIQESNKTEMLSSAAGFVEGSDNIKVDQTANEEQFENEQSTIQKLKITEITILEEDIQNKFDVESSVDIKAKDVPEEELRMVQELKSTEILQSTAGVVKAREKLMKKLSKNKLDLDSKNNIKAKDVPEEELRMIQELMPTENPQSTDGFVEAPETHPKDDLQNELNLECTNDDLATIKMSLGMKEDLKSMPLSTNKLPIVCATHLQEDTQINLGLESNDNIITIETAINTEVEEGPETIQELKPTGESFQVSELLAAVTQNNLNLKCNDDIKAIKMVNDSQLRKKSEMTQKSTSTRFSLSTDEFIKVLIMTPVQPDEYWVILHQRFFELHLIDTHTNYCGRDNRINEPILNEMYLVQFEDKWCRATVTELNPLTVFCIDYGNLDLCKTEDLYEVPNDLRNIYPMAIKIKLARGSPHRFLNLNPHSILKVKLISLLPNNTYLVRVMDVSSEEE